MKNVFFLSLGLMVYSTFAATQVVSDVTVTDGDKLTITYRIDDRPAVVTLDIRTNNVSIGAENFRSAIGDVNIRVEPGTHTITWRAHRDWPNHRVANTTAVVTAWPVDDPPPYLVADLKKGGQPDVKYYVSTNALPGGFDNGCYKTTKLLMRKIPATGVRWLMGSPDPSRQDKEFRHPVVLTRDYYMGVYPVTQGQYTNVVESFPYPTAFTNFTDSPFHPVNYHAYNMVRGVSPAIDWPSTGTNVAPNCVIQKFRDRTGLVIDLPTEAQWEFACRAGTATDLYNGESTADNLNRIAWNQGIAQKVSFQLDPGGTVYEGYPSRAVGEMEPNAFGLYDMIGNATEYCLDWYGEDYRATYDEIGNSALTIDPVGLKTKPSTAPKRVIRGGSVATTYPVSTLRASMRASGDEGATRGWNNGFRFVCPAIAE